MTLRLRNPVVRDLEGIMASPSLLAPFRAEVITDQECAQDLDAHRNELLALDHDPSPLLAWLEVHGASRLLGRYFEALIGYWIQHLYRSPRLEISIKVMKEKRTLGEMDFVFTSSESDEASNKSEASSVARRAGIHHWEASVKFYLCVAPTLAGGLNTDQFIGTMTQDRLDKKMALLFDRQLRLASEPEGLAAIRAAGFMDSIAAKASDIQDRLFMKGALFYPADRDWRQHPHPPEVSTRHLRGWWSKDLPPGDRWVILDRRRWLSPFYATADYEPMQRAELQRQLSIHFVVDRMAFMVAEVSREAVTGEWFEQSRGLVVHPGWPWRGVDPVSRKT